VGGFWEGGWVEHEDFVGAFGEEEEAGEGGGGVFVLVR
jgi:hypothetical protein